MRSPNQPHSGILVPYGGIAPTLAADVFVAPGSAVIGDVHMGAGSSVWFGAVVRGDVRHIRIGAGVNIQDLTMIHVTHGGAATHIGDAVTIGHRAVLHGCTVEPRALIGMGAVIMDDAVVGAESMIGAGALVTPGTVIPPRTLAVGSPAKVRRALTDGEVRALSDSAVRYTAYAKRYMDNGWGLQPTPTIEREP